MVTLVVEDGTGLTNANTYISDADALTYFTNRGDTVWSAATTADRDAALVRASFGMDWWLTGRWFGRKTTQAQALEWPRCGVRDEDGRRVATNVVPNRVAMAAAEISKIELTTPFIQQEVNRDNMIQAESVGPINVTYMKNAPSIAYWPQIIAMLRAYARIGVMPIDVWIGLMPDELGRDRDRLDGNLNPFDFPDYFHLIKDPTYNVGGLDNDWDWY